MCSCNAAQEVYNTFPPCVIYMNYYMCEYMHPFMCMSVHACQAWEMFLPFPSLIA